MKRVAIFGPPGTGKTTTLLSIVEEKLRGGCLPENIAFVSFTRKAAHEARDRAFMKFRQYDKKRFKYFRTIHSLALRTLNLGKADVMTPKDWEQFNELVGAKLVVTPRSGVTELHRQQLRTAGDVALFYIGKARLEGRDWRTVYMEIPAAVRSPTVVNDVITDYVANQDPVSEDDYLRFGAKLEAFKADRGLIDFTDMLEVALAQSMPLMIDYAIVDEAQDLSRVQWKLVEKLFAHVGELYMAGDDDQAIYRWAGADVAEFQMRAAACDDVRVLDRSYRLTASVFAVANRISARIEGERQVKTWKPRPAAGATTTFTDLARVPLLEDGTWYLLSRAKVHWVHYTRLLAQAFIPYTIHHLSNVNTAHIRGLLAYNQLTLGRAITVEDAVHMYKLLWPEMVEKDARLDDEQPDVLVNTAILRQKYGLKGTVTVPFQFDQRAHPLRLNARRRHWYFSYFKRCKAQGVGYYLPPRHHIDTIHGVKGGEADHVVVLSDTTARISDQERGSQLVQDDEHRIFYVAATRAKSSLWIAAHPISRIGDFAYRMDGLVDEAARSPATVDGAQ